MVFYNGSRNEQDALIQKIVSQGAGGLAADIQKQLLEEEYRARTNRPFGDRKLLYPGLFGSRESTPDQSQMELTGQPMQLH